MSLQFNVLTASKAQLDSLDDHLASKLVQVATEPVDNWKLVKSKKDVKVYMHVHSNVGVEEADADKEAHVEPVEQVAEGKVNDSAAGEIVDWTEKDTPCPNIVIIKGEAYISESVEDLLAFFRDTEASFKSLDEMLLHINVPHLVDDNRKILHTSFKLPFPCWKREFVFYQSLKHIEVEGGGKVSVLFSRSVNVEDVPPMKGAVRGNIASSGWIFTATEDPKKTLVQYVVQVDPKVRLAFICFLVLSFCFSGLDSICRCFSHRL
jgi:hypothetical protein